MQSTPCDAMHGVSSACLPAAHSSLASAILAARARSPSQGDVEKAPHLDAGVAGEQRHEAAPHRLAAIQTGLRAHLQPVRRNQCAFITHRLVAKHTADARGLLISCVLCAQSRQVAAGRWPDRRACRHGWGLRRASASAPARRSWPATPHPRSPRRRTAPPAQPQVGWELRRRLIVQIPTSVMAGWGAMGVL